MTVKTPNRIAASQAVSQVIEASARPSSDVFSLCVQLYELLAGTPLFDGADEAAKARQRQKGERPIELVPNLDVSPTLKNILIKGLAPDPKDRFASVLELEEALRQSLDERRPPYARYAVIFAIFFLPLFFYCFSRSQHERTPSSLPSTESGTLELVVNEDALVYLGAKLVAEAKAGVHFELQLEANRPYVFRFVNERLKLETTRRFVLSPGMELGDQVELVRP